MAKRNLNFRSDSGLVTAEFAIVLPAVVALLVLGLAIISAQVQAARLQQLAAFASHALARFEDPQVVSDWLRERAPSAKLSTKTKDGVLCASVVQSIHFVIYLDALKVSEQSCTWVGREVGIG
jgi:hypothetical protein